MTCAVAQLPLVPTVKVSDEGITVTESSSLLERLTVRFEEGSVAGTMVYVAVPPSLSMVTSRSSSL